MGRQLAFHVDAQYCAGCKTCQVACKDRANVEVGQLWRKVVQYESGEWIKEGETWRNSVSAYWVSLGCNHCEDPACVNACPTGAMYKRESDGIVLVETERCVGCKVCTWACPYNGPQYNPATNKMGKCDLCVDRLALGQRTVCEEACPFQLITVGYLDEIEATKGGTPWVGGLADPGLTTPSLRITPPVGAIRTPRQRRNGG